MFTVGNYHEELSLAISKGLLVKEKGGIAFESKEEAQEWAIEHMKEGFQIYPLCTDCVQGSYSDTPTMKYKTMKRLNKPVKLLSCI